MTEAEVWDAMEQPEIKAAILEKFEDSTLLMREIAVAVGLPEGRGYTVGQFIRSIVGTKAFKDRCSAIQRRNQTGARMEKLCGECKSFLPEAKRVNGIRYGTCKKTGKTVSRCTECRMEGVRKNEKGCG